MGGPRLTSKSSVHNSFGSRGRAGELKKEVVGWGPWGARLGKSLLDGGSHFHNRGLVHEITQAGNLDFFFNVKMPMHFLNQAFGG